MSKIAIIETGGKQYRIQENNIIKIEKLDANEGDNFSFDKVLLLSEEDGSDIKMGTPYLDGSVVEGKILTQGRDKKIRVGKYKAKVRYKRVYGHRQPFTKIQITKIPS